MLWGRGLSLKRELAFIGNEELEENQNRVLVGVGRFGSSSFPMNKLYTHKRGKAVRSWSRRVFAFSNTFIAFLTFFVCFYF